VIKNCGRTVTATYGLTAVKEGLLTGEADQHFCLCQLRTLFRLGLFDAAEEDPYGHLGWDHVGTDEHREIALEGARQSIVLLQNGNGTTVLPIHKNQKDIARQALWPMQQTRSLETTTATPALTEVGIVSFPWQN
jgi:beta-glucosidase-like glycosyl hydrolase